MKDTQATKMNLHPLTLKFSGESSHLEELFQHDFFRASLRINRAALLIAVLFYSLFGILDALLMPEKRADIWFIRFFVVDPALLAVFLLSFTKSFRKYANPLLSAVTILAGIGIIWMIVIAPAPVNYSYYAGIMLLFMWSYAFARIPFLWASLIGWVLVFFYQVAAIGIIAAPLAVIINNNFFFVSANIMGMIACYSLEYFARGNYFLTKQIEAEQEEINRINLALEQEIDVRRQAENALLENDQRFRLITDNIRDTIWLMDMNLHTTWISPSVEKIWGFPVEELKRRPWERHLTPASFQSVQELIGKHLTPERLANPHEEILVETEIESVRSDRSTLWMDIIVTLLRNAKGVPTGFLGIARDTTERRRMEEALRQSREIFTSLVNAIPDMIFRTNLEGMILYVNENTLQISGFKRDEVEGRHILEFIAPEDQAQVIQNSSLMMENKSGPREFRIIMKDGSRVPFEVNSNFLHNEEGVPLGIVNVCRNITERKKAEQALQQNEHNLLKLASYHEKLNAISITFTEALSVKDLNHKIAESLRMLTVAMATNFSIYHPSTSELTLKSLSMNPEYAERFNPFFGPELFEMRMPVGNQDLAQMLKERILKPKDICDLSFGVIPREVSDAVMEAFGHPLIIALPIIYAEEVLGTCVIYLPADEPALPDDALKTFTYIAGMAITRKRATEALRLAHAELEQRVAERTYELTAANSNLKELFQKQEINIDLAKNILSMINYRPNRHTRLPDNIILFFTACYLPCYAEGGDHFFIKDFPVRRPGISKTAVSLKDQSGHEVSCILRSIITDLIHNALLVQTPDLPIEETITRLNKEICDLSFFGDDNFFTSIDAEINHENLKMQYVSSGHPAFLFIRGRDVVCLPSLESQARNLPIGVFQSVDFMSSEIQLQKGDKMIFFTDGLTDMPHMSGKPVLNAEDMKDMVSDIVRKESGLPVSILMARIFNRINGQEGDSLVIPRSLYDDITLMGIELECGNYEYEDIVRPQNLGDMDHCVNRLFQKISAEWKERGFSQPETRLRMVLDEAMVNAWVHGNREDPKKMIVVRRCYGNDAVLEVIDEGNGFDYKAIYDPTRKDNLLKPQGRGNFIMRLLTEETQWKDGGRHLIAYFAREYQTERTIRPFSGFNLWRKLSRDG